MLLIRKLAVLRDPCVSCARAVRCAVCSFLFAAAISSVTTTGAQAGGHEEAAADQPIADEPIKVRQAEALPVEEIRIIGTRDQAGRIAGSAHVIDEEQLRGFARADIQNILRQVPSVVIQMEDGYGLRPNIGIRGSATERSARITLLEDGVLIAPAPYAAPAAYYFPTAARMVAFETLKGSAAITQGPYTVGGALNMISTPIPEERSGRLKLYLGEDATQRTHLIWGDRQTNGFGILLETHHWASDGFQDIDRSANDTGLLLADYVLKLAYAPSQSQHSVELQLQATEQTAEQSYLGLIDADFNHNPNRRYGVSALDEIDAEHSQFKLSYAFDMDSRFSFSAVLYNNEHARDWFKTEGLDFDGSTNAEGFNRMSWYNVIQAINRDQDLVFTLNNDSTQSVSADMLAAILHGSTDTMPGSIQVRSNNRKYVSRGIQFKLRSNFGATVKHSLEAGLRSHNDEEDRLQRNSSYQQMGGSLALNDLGKLGNAGNRIQKAEALVLYVRDEIQIGDWIFSPGMRYEDIEQKRVNYSTSGPSPSLRAAGVTRSNTERVFLPGFGALYELNSNWRMFVGAHKGFVSPGNAPGVEAETSISYELGARFVFPRLSGEAALFRTDYDDILGECTNSSSGDCEEGDAFNGDAALIDGLELSLQAELLNGGAASMPLSFVATWMDARFENNIADTDFFGDVSAGDPLPYYSDLQFYMEIAYIASVWDVRFAANYVGSSCTRASCASYEQIESQMTFDVAGHWNFRDGISSFARIENLSDEQFLLGRHPYGARPARGRAIVLGIDWSF